MTAEQWLVYFAVREAFLDRPRMRIWTRCPAEFGRPGANVIEVVGREYFGDRHGPQRVVQFRDYVHPDGAARIAPRVALHLRRQFERRLLPQAQPSFIFPEVPVP